jgi:MoxR-like ATPase
MSTDLIEYGSKLDAQSIAETLAFLFDANLKNELSTGERPTPICIWGTHGLGKTQSVVTYAREREWKMAYCAPAQFEEMGDLHGLPTKMDPDPTRFGDEYTMYLPPDWVPTEEGPGILLLDDFNRADDRILRGLMQLLQNFEMFSWSLPPKWQIVCTANPEGGDYSVTPMDDAMLTRLLHMTMVFDVKAWASWAVKNNIDPRGIAFVLTYPEVITGQRTTPRSITAFFQQIRHITDLKAELNRVLILANSSLDDVTVSAFLAFVTDNLSSLIHPEEILEAEKFSDIAKRVKELATGKGDARRVDRLATICTRLYLHLAKKDYEPGETDAHNLVEFLLLDVIPSDLRFSLHKDLVSLGAKTTAMLNDSRLARLILAGM